MLRAALGSLVLGFIVESGLFLCTLGSGGIGPCGPTTAQAFIGLIGHIPVVIAQGVVGREFTNTGVFLANGSIVSIALFGVAIFIRLFTEK